MKLSMNSVKLPKKIEPCPILEAIVELRFETQFPGDAIFGIIYKEFKGDYPKVEELPILQLPETVRSQDPNLRYKPYYKLSGGNNFLFQVGARALSLISLQPYAGWEIFSEKLSDLLKRVSTQGVIDKYTRIGLRYINGFEFNIYEKVNMCLKMEEHNLTNFETSIRLQIPTNSFTSTLRVANNAEVRRDNKVLATSMIDIDTFLDNPGEVNIELLQKGHLEEKQLFFSLLKDSYIKNELNPEY